MKTSPSSVARMRRSTAFCAPKWIFSYWGITSCGETKVLVISFPPGALTPVTTKPRRVGTGPAIRGSGRSSSRPCVLQRLPYYQLLRLNFAQTQLSLYLWARQEQAGGAGKLQNVTAVTDPPSRFWQLGMAQEMDQV